MASLKAALFALVTLAVATQAAAQNATGKVPAAYDFVCDFKSRTTLTGKDFDDLRPKHTTTADRLTFIIPTSACRPPFSIEESYYLSEGDSRQFPTFVQCTDGRVTVMERTDSDNLFVVSILSEDKSRPRTWRRATYYSALKTWQGWVQGVDFYRPYISTGRCHLF